MSNAAALAHRGGWRSPQPRVRARRSAWRRARGFRVVGARPLCVAEGACARRGRRTGRGRRVCPEPRVSGLAWRSRFCG